MRIFIANLGKVSQPAVYTIHDDNGSKKKKEVTWRAYKINQKHFSSQNIT